MKTETETKQALREWVAKKNGKIAADAVKDSTPIIEQRLITSAQVLDLILYIESESGRPIDVETLKIGVFRNVNAIYDNFFRSSQNG